MEKIEEACLDEKWKERSVRVNSVRDSFTRFFVRAYIVPSSPICLVNGFVKMTVFRVYQVQ